MKLGVIAVLFLFVGTCFAQVPNMKIQKENTHFYIDNKLVGNLNYIVTNNGNVPVWLWFSKENISLLENSQKIKRYFKIPPSMGDGSYYQWMCDGNVESFISSLFFYFGKVIQPKEKFYISFTYQNTDISTMIPAIDTHLNIVSEKEIMKQCPGIETKAVKEQFTFRPSIITIPWDYFRKAL